VLDVAEATLGRLDAYNRIKAITAVEGNVLRIGTKVWDLSTKRNVYLVGAGKAANHMARAVDEVLGDKLTQGIVIVKIAEEGDVFHRTDIRVGGHPIPNEEGYAASLDILDLVEQATADDLFIAVISGGSSALMSCPVEGISLQDEMDTTDILLKSGAGIYEINAIRRHISRMNGGMLAKAIAEKGAELIGFGISDAVGTPPTGDYGVPYANYASTPIGPDKTTLADARRVIRDYALENRLPASVVNYLMNVGNEGETPKSFPHNTYYLLNTLPDSCIYAKEAAEELGVPAIILTSFLEGEAKDAGMVMSSIAREIQQYGNPVPAPCIVLSSGEVTTRIPSNSEITGTGGPGCEMTTGFSLTAPNAPGSVLFSIDSEGTDGTAMAAGGLTDSTTLARADEVNLNVHDALRGHATHELLAAVGDSVFTGNTGTNLCDLNILYVPVRSNIQ
jgi:glycerate-2-kinase